MPDKATGFASPALGYEEQAIDLNRLLIRNPAATYLVRLESDDMAELGLLRGARLIVDRSKVPGANELVMLRHEGRFLCRLMTKKGGKAAFSNGTEEFYPVADETEIIGTITAAIISYDNAH